MEITLKVTAFENLYGRYNAAENSFDSLGTRIVFDKKEIAAPDGLEFLRQRKTKVAVKIPIEILKNYIVEE